MDLQKKVLRFVMEHPYSTHHQCAKALCRSELAVLHELHELKREGKLRLSILPLGNEKDPNCSEYFYATK